MDRRLPRDYAVRLENDNFIDSPTPIVHQHQVYQFLSYIADRAGTARIIDIGCGSGQKLAGLDNKFEIVGIDGAWARDLFRSAVPKAQFIAHDLEEGLPTLAREFYQNAIVVCSDVVEHIRKPEKLLGDLAAISAASAYMLLSTPDRVRARGLLDQGPPANKAHTMEWSADEFGRFMLDCGFPRGFLLGYTLNNDRDLSKSTILAVAGREATLSRPGAQKAVAAVVPVYNESDVLEPTMRHLRSQGIDVHIIDNWSTDGSFELGDRLVKAGICKSTMRYPARPIPYYDWTNILRLVENHPATLESDWTIFCDADELREAPWKGCRLVEAISFVDSLGYSAIDFTVMNFLFTSGAQPFSSPAAMRFFDFGRHPAHLLQIKAWKNKGQQVDLASSGGHDAKFSGRRLYPLKFLNRHYPLRSAEQATRKLFVDRFPRIEKERKEKGWHAHYDTYRAMGQIEPWRQFELQTFDDHMFYPEYLVERLSGIGIELEPRAIPNINSRLRQA